MEIDAVELVLMLEGIELKDAKRRKRFRPDDKVERTCRLCLFGDRAAIDMRAVTHDNEHESAMTAPKLAPVQAQGALPMPRALLTAGVELDPVTERERESRMEELKAELSRMLADGKGQ